MGRRKLNMFPWSVGLAAVMTVFCLIGAVGVSYARYQINRSESVFYTPAEPAQVYLGNMVSGENGQTVFDSQTVSSWKQVNGGYELIFAVANGATADGAAQRSQRVQLRLAGSLGIWDGQQTVNVTLRIPREIVSGQPLQVDEISGQAARIQPESPLYGTFGDGWVFTFPDDNGEETAWLLEGGKFSCMHFSVLIEGVELTDPSLLQLTATGVYVPEEP